MLGQITSFFPIRNLSSCFVCPRAHRIPSTKSHSEPTFYDRLKNMATNSISRVPAFYTVFFTSIDPLIALGGGAYIVFFRPQTFIDQLFPRTSPYSVITPSHTLLLHQLGGTFLMVGFLQVFMLRYTKDLAIWKFLQFSILIEDVVLFYSLYAGLVTQNRLALESVRAEEWGSVAITGFVLIARVLFLLEVGFKKVGGSAGKKRR
ncbi:hypothetical protein BDV96DRAFT_583696 [Lophiotrema nucula]|uniref:DUF7704 domain-containing protein n=1 Tax=Lophiotrema nucula TaxID=690887 RepID=A0A6A5YW43_9PLEO|nr:hypothetical protein BDV96DRAFT_583696 [Lophiotrema nucula]